MMCNVNRYISLYQAFLTGLAPLLVWWSCTCTVFLVCCWASVSRVAWKKMVFVWRYHTGPPLDVAQDQSTSVLFSKLAECKIWQTYRQTIKTSPKSKSTIAQIKKLSLVRELLCSFSQGAESKCISCIMKRVWERSGSRTKHWKTHLIYICRVCLTVFLKIHVSWMRHMHQLVASVQCIVQSACKLV